MAAFALTTEALMLVTHLVSVHSVHALHIHADFDFDGNQLVPESDIRDSKELFITHSADSAAHTSATIQLALRASSTFG